MLIVGARQAREAGVLDRDHTPLYDGGLVLEWTGTELVERFVWPAPLKGASWDGERLLLNSDRELLWVDPGSWDVVDRWTHPDLDDVHHALRFDGRVWVANTGRHEVIAVGERLVRHDVGEGSHPNHLFEHDQHLWITRFHRRDAITLDGLSMRIEGERPHDGLSRADGVWFTAVDGQLVCVSPSGCRSVRIEQDGPEPLGWCRGLWFDGEDAWVGLTRIRATRARQNLAWARGTLRGTQFATRRPTRVVRVAPSGEIRETIRVDEAGIDAIFATLGPFVGRMLPVQEAR